MQERFAPLFEEPFALAVMSGFRKGQKAEFSKVTVTPFDKKGESMWQFTYVYPKKEIHENVPAEEGIEKLYGLFDIFTQCQIYSKSHDYHVTLFSKMKIKTADPTKTVEKGGHDREKDYIISPTEGADFLKELGVMGENGTVNKAKYDKFRQINRYLEFVSDISDSLFKGEDIKVVDFGCGKSYLTFALYYYLTQKKGRKAKIEGLDLKKDVIEHCSSLAKKLGYDGLTFSYGDIKDYEGEAPTMVISLHACDTATDEALFKGILWKSPVLMAVPCCQHELNPQLKEGRDTGMLRYGLIRERLAALITDTARALLLESVGYRTDVIEFIPTEHTPKNILIRGVLKGGFSEKHYREYLELKKQWGFEHTLEKRLRSAGLLPKDE